MNRSLFCITTANQLEYSKMAFESFMEANVPGADFLVVDDASDDGTREFFRSRGVRVIAKEDARGVTDSWNAAYRIFRDEGYDALLLANNDILVSRGAVANLLEALERYVLCGPLTTAKGAGSQPLQAIGQHISLPVDADDPASHVEVQRLLSESARGRVLELPLLNGFFLGMSRAILRYERPDGLLFDPSNVNVGNEDDLCLRVIEPKVCCLDSFVYHFKGRSFDFHTKPFRGSDLLDRNYTWKEARAISRPSLRRAREWIRVSVEKTRHKILRSPCSSRLVRNLLSSYLAVRGACQRLSFRIGLRRISPPVNLHLGSGWKYLDGYLNIDLHSRKADLIADCRKMEFFPSEIANHILCEHMLEHLSRRDGESALREWARLLRPGGKLEVEVPDLVWCIENFLSSPEESRYAAQYNGTGAISSIYGLQTNPGHFHQFGYTAAHLEGCIRACGLEIDDVRIYMTPHPCRSIRIVASKPPRGEA